MVFRATGKQDYYYFEFNSFNKGSTCTSVDADKRNRLSSATGTVPNDEWHTIKVVLEGDRFDMFLNGTKVMSANDSRRPQGYVGIRTWDCLAQFRRFKVTTLTGEVLHEGIPEWKQ